MTTEPSDRPASPAPDRAGRGVRLRRRIARTVVAIDVVVLLAVLFRLGFVDINDHPGLVTTVWIAVPVFVLAFPFMGFRDARPGEQQRHRRGQGHE